MSAYHYGEAIRTFYRAHRRMPTYSEMLGLFRFKSKNAVAKVIAKLIDNGELIKDHKGNLMLSRMPGEVPLAGYVEAGMPSPAEAAELDTVSVTDMLVGDAKNVFALRVKGESMVDAGIHNGDTVLVKQGDTARPGQIVIACIDGDWTMKYLREKKGMRYLEAANPDYPDLIPEESLEIGGVVIGIIRKFA